MILIVAEVFDLAISVKEILLGLGIVSEICKGNEACEIIGERHNGVIAVGRNLGIGAVELLLGLRKIKPRIPIFAIREDIFSPDAAAFDGVYPGSLYFTRAIEKMKEIAKERGTNPVGEYSLFGISVLSSGVFYEKEGIPLTKSEAAVLRTVIAFYPSGVSAGRIAQLSFRTSRAPSESGVRTHISSINKKLSFICDSELSATSDGYTLALRVMPTV